LIAFAAFVSVFFLTLYMQNVLGYSPIRSGSAYLPVTFGIVVAAGSGTYPPSRFTALTPKTCSPG
jgi:hypothetical protein